MDKREIIKKVILREEKSLREGLVALNENGMQILLIVNEKDQLCGVLTDGDVRRYILRNGPLDKPVEEIMNREFVSLNLREAERAQDLIKKCQFNHVPILDDSGRIVDLVTGFVFREGLQPIGDIPVVVMAGGKGTRLSPLTRILPKPLMPVGEQTMLEKIMENFSEHGFQNFYVIVNYKKELIKTYFSEIQVPSNIEFIDENEYLGTVGGLRLLKDTLRKPFILTNCDILAKLQYPGLIDWHFEHDAKLTILGVRKRFDIPYGVVNVNEGYSVTAIDEKPSYDRIVVSGVYMIDPSLLDLIPEKEVYGMDQLIKACMRFKKKVTCYPIEDGWFDMGHFDEYRHLMKKLGVLGV